MIEERRRRILLDAIKKVATDKRCPKWAEEILMKAVITAKNLVEETTETFEFLDVQPEIGSHCMNIDTKDKSIYQIEEYVTTVNNVKLWNVKIIKGDAKNPIGTIIHNVPSSILRVIK